VLHRSIVRLALLLHVGVRHILSVLSLLSDRRGSANCMYKFLLGAVC